MLLVLHLLAGTSFMITTGPTPELDKTNLVVGKVMRTGG
jgi:cyclophilin family peptidyl-prolyl cis-trans isomerase